MAAVLIVAVAIVSTGIAYIWLMSAQATVGAAVSSEAQGISLPPRILAVVPTSTGMTVRLRPADENTPLTVYILDARKDVVLKSATLEPATSVFIPWIRAQDEYVVIKACQRSCAYSNPTFVPKSEISGWTIAFSSPDGNVGPVSTVVDGDTIIGAATAYPNAPVSDTTAAPPTETVVTVIREDGSVIWAKELNFNVYEELKPVMAVNGKILLAGEFNNASAVVELYESNGAITRAVEIQGIGARSASADGNYVYLVGTGTEGGLVVVAFDPESWSVRWAQAISSADYSLSALDIVGDNGAYIIFQGSATEGGSTIYGILKLDQDGNVLWAKAYNAGSVALVPVALAPTGSTAVASLGYQDPDTGAMWTYVADLNETGGAENPRVVWGADSNNIVALGTYNGEVLYVGENNYFSAGVGTAWRLPGAPSKIEETSGGVVVAPEYYPPGSSGIREQALLFGVVSGVGCSPLPASTAKEVSAASITDVAVSVTASAASTTLASIAGQEKEGNVTRIC